MKVTLEAGVSAMLESAKEIIKDLHPENSSAFANDPQVIAYIALILLIDSDLAQHALKSSYPLQEPPGSVPRSLRYAETYGWSIVFKMVKEEVQIESLKRVENF